MPRRPVTFSPRRQLPAEKSRVKGFHAIAFKATSPFAIASSKWVVLCEYGENEITISGGKLRGIDADMNAISDTVQTLAAVALFAEGPTTIGRAAHIRHKETDRIHALACELRKLGAGVEERPDGLRIIPGKLRGARIETYNDHRMAMSMALVGLAVPGVIILDPECTAKTYPDFFADLARIAEKAALINALPIFMSQTKRDQSTFGWRPWRLYDTAYRG